jgi:hypothetical protein
MIPAKTLAGQQVLKDRSGGLTPRQRTALILIDGKRSVGEVLRSGVAMEDVQRLFELQLVTESDNVADQTAPMEPARDTGASLQQRYAAAYPIAAQLTAGLGLRGFRLNLAVEAATCYEDLVALSDKIREAVGSEKFAPLGAALRQDA